MDKVTVGRCLHYWPLNEEKSSEHNQPFCAQVVHVHSDQCVALVVHNELGYQLLGKTSVILRDTPAEAAPGECSWMAYHVATAAKSNKAIGSGDEPHT